MFNNGRGDGKTHKIGRNEWHFMVRGETIISHDMANNTEKAKTGKGAYNLGRVRRDLLGKTEHSTQEKNFSMHSTS